MKSTLTAAFVFTALVTGSLQAAPMEFRLEGNGGNCGGCEWIIAEGEITNDTPAKFQQFIAKELGGNAGGEIVFNSPGGNLIAALKLGEMLRKGNFSTSVGSSRPLEPGDWRRERAPGICASACAFSFLGGTTRNAAAGEVGVHQFYSDVALANPSAKAFTALDLSNNQILSGVLVAYISSMGADARLMTIASLTKPESMHFLTAEELEELRVVWNPWKFKPWSIEPYGNGVVAFSKTYDERETATFFCRKDRKARLLISTKSDKSGSGTAAPDIVSGAKVLGFVVGRNDMAWSSKDGHDRLEITINDFDLNRLPQSNDDLSIDVTDFAPHVAWGLNRSFSANGLKANFRVALKNCL